LTGWSKSQFWACFGHISLKLHLKWIASEASEEKKEKIRVLGINKS